MWGFPQLYWQCQFSCTCGWICHGGFWSIYRGLCWSCVFAHTIYIFMYLCSCICFYAHFLIYLCVWCFAHHTSRRRTQWYSNRVLNWITCVCISLAMPLQYFILAPITMALFLTLNVVTAAKPDPHTLGVCFTCLFSQESRILPSILSPPSVFYCVQHTAADVSGVRWGSRL